MENVDDACARDGGSYGGSSRTIFAGRRVQLILPTRGRATLSAAIRQRNPIAALRNPLLRNGHLLTLSSALTSAVGIGYWTLAAREYDAGPVGSNSAAISMMILVAAIAQLNFPSAMVRFIPTAGPRMGVFVARVYLISGSVALLVGLSTVALVRLFSPATEFLEGPLPQAMFVFATVAYALFTIQDGVLTALRRAELVPLENLAFAVLKLGLVVAFAAALPLHGIFASWAVALGLTVCVVGTYIFTRAIPARQRSGSPELDTLPPAREIARYVAFDYLGAIFSIGSMTLLPVIVVGELGPEQNAYFAIAWLIAYSIHLINVNMGTSLVLESATDQSRLDRQIRHILTHTGKLVLLAVIVIVPFAPRILGIFGTDYEAATGTLRLLVLAAVPHLLVATAVSSARAQRRMRLVLGIQVLQFALSLPLAWLLLRMIGLSGAGVAWLATQVFIAGVLLARRRWWLDVGAGSTDATAAGTGSLWWSLAARGMTTADAMRMRSLVQRAALFARGGRGPGADPIAATGEQDLPISPAWTETRHVPTVSDVSVTLLGEKGRPPAAVLKVGTTALGSADLRNQREVLAVLRADSRLDGEWRALLPRILAFRDHSDRALSLETFAPGIDMRSVLAAAPDSVTPLCTLAIGTVDHLHQRTGEIQRVDDEHLRHWVDEPLAELTEFCHEVAPATAPVIERLGGALHAGLRGRHALVSWTHGDFTPGNVRLDRDAVRVTGVLDWGGARAGQLAAVDGCQLVLSARCVAERRELGAVVRTALRAGHYAPGPGIVPGRTGGQDIGERTLTLLAWLQHAAHLHRKCLGYRGHRLWWALNAQPVLRAFRVMDRVRGNDPLSLGAGR